MIHAGVLSASPLFVSTYSVDAQPPAASINISAKALVLGTNIRKLLGSLLVGSRERRIDLAQALRFFVAALDQRLLVGHLSSAFHQESQALA